jgi:hypothetical protein
VAFGEIVAQRVKEQQELLAAAHGSRARVHLDIAYGAMLIIFCLLLFTGVNQDNTLLFPLFVFVFAYLQGKCITKRQDVLMELIEAHFKDCANQDETPKEQETT